MRKGLSLKGDLMKPANVATFLPLAAMWAHFHKKAITKPFDEQMKRLRVPLKEQMAEARRLEEAIWENLRELGYGK
jgi:hypothetical protein